MFALLSLWRRVVRLLRSIGLALSKGSKIVWSKKIEEATDIANDYLDHKNYPKISESSDGYQNTSPEEEKPRTRLLKRLLKRRR